MRSCTHITFGYSHIVMSFLSAVVVPCFYINLHAVCELTCSNNFRNKQGVLKLMVGAQGPVYRPTIYRVT